MRLIFILCISLFFIACKNEPAKQDKTAVQAEQDSANYTTVLYTDPTQNLGVLKMGEKAEIKFHFTNTGDKPLFIINAEPSCGCTVADFPKEPVAPNSSGVIVANFDTNKGQIGNFSKVITVTTNTKPSANNVLTFSGEIRGKNGETEETPEPVTETKSNKN